MILIQHITLQWYKECRGGSYAAQRNKFVQAAVLPPDFFDYIPFGIPVHRQLLLQKKDAFHILADRRVIEEFSAQNSLRLSPMELIPAVGGGCEMQYRYDWHKGAIPPRHQYDPTGGQMPLREPAFELHTGDYGRAVCNGRFVDLDTGNWWYELSITNVLVLAQKKAPPDCFLTNTPTHWYRQIAQLR